MTGKTKEKDGPAEENISMPKNKPKSLIPFAAVFVAFLGGSLMSLGIVSFTTTDTPNVGSSNICVEGPALSQCQTEKDVVVKQLRELQAHARINWKPLPRP
eukprot:GEMP01138841.1.p1 GENE.GEMP01138841.1~~GEMP01138841.1.p1  ORF type:complete len:101 (+),score=16.99 GEMP01138841.1:93-395(+)